MAYAKAAKNNGAIPFMKSLIFAVLIWPSYTVYAFDDEHIDAHVHGLVEINLIAEANHIEVEITSPLMNLVGFEYAARTEAEKVAIHAMAAHFDAPHEWLQFNGSLCELTHRNIHYGEDEHDDHGHHDNHDSPHAELEANYKFKCNSEGLDSVTVSLQEYFPAIDSIKLNWIVDTTSGTATLRHDDRQVYFKQ